MLQRLHTEGGVLEGDVDVFVGTGMAALPGKRLAHKFGVHAGKNHMRVEISHHDDGIHWARSFNGQSPVLSIFEPVGTMDAGGYWMERSGAVHLKLGAVIEGDSWRWQHRETRVRGLPVPGWFVPQAVASKRIENGQYIFSVAMSLPGLGKLFGYGGVLDICF